MNLHRPLQNLDLNLLRVFVITYHEKNLKRAAKRLSTSAPSVSVKLSKLKDRVGGELFYKTKDGFEPTELADRLFQRVDPLISGLYESVDNLDRFDPSTIERPIIMDIGQNLIPWLAPKMHAQIFSACPNSHLIANYFTNSSIDRLRKEEIQMGLQVSAFDVPKDIIEIPLGHLETGAIVRNDHPFKGQEATLEQIVKYDYIFVEQTFHGLGLGGPFLQAMKQRNIDLNIKFRSPSMMAIFEILKTTDMVLPAAVNLIENNDTDFRVIKVKDCPEMRTLPVNAYIHQKHRHSKKINWLLELLKKEMPQ
ncbi:LysR family transcriptional regulator [Photobacterium sp. BZF1]|uniref:LysR family transcriptional regulator n=1 Tax=Photobacterium sp. BZF1 TaxID=1904457 RepID=UPI00165362B5|nr:LysR family transcriptional regulator [Photobacterium sp. BZF1]MBC7001057.1 LysR family transcriptional regulator [Photobacterium sp. BZF1]